MRKFSATATVTALATVGDFDVSNTRRACFDIANSAAAALSAFEVHIKAHPDGNFYKIASATADFNAPVGIVVACVEDDGTTIDLTQLGTSKKGMLIIDTAGIDTIRLKAAGTASALTVVGSAS